MRQRVSVSGGGSAGLLLLLGIVAIALADLSSSDRIPAYRDLLVFVVPFKYFLAEHLRAGLIPLWNPWIYLGTPFLGSLQSGVFYPPSVLFFLKFPRGFNLFLLSHFFVASAGAWQLFRDQRLSPPAAVVGALTYALGGFFISMVNVTNNLQACAWTPWVLLFWRRYVEHPTRTRILLTSVAIAIQLLGGAPEASLMTLAVAAGWAVWDTMPRWRKTFRLEVSLCGAVAVAAALTAFQIGPTLEYLGQSARGAALPFDEVSTWSMQPVSLLQLVFPYSVSLARAETNPDHLLLESMPPWIHSFYFGLVPLCLAISALTIGRERIFWGPLLFAAIVMALGANTPLFGLLYRAAPWVIGKFRYPEKFYFLVHLSAAVLAAEGAEACFRGDERVQRIACVAAGTLIAAAAALLCLRWSKPDVYLTLVARLTGRYRPMTEYVPLAVNLAFKAQRVLLILGSFVALVVFRRMSVLQGWTAALLVTGLVATDLASTNYGLNWGISWSALQSERPLVDVAELRRTGGRIFLYQTTSDPLPGRRSEPVRGLEHWSRARFDSQSFEAAARGLWRLLFIDIPMVYGVGTLSGGDGITRSSDNTLRLAISVVPRDRAVKILEVFGTAYFIGPTPLDSPDLERVDDPSSAPFFVYRVRRPLPIAYLASRLFPAATAVDSFNQIIQPGFRPGFDAAVESFPPGWDETRGPSPTGTLTTLAWREEAIEFRVRSEHSEFLVLNTSFYPGWEARIDGALVSVVRANALVQGVVIGPGDHRVEFRYRPRSLLIGAAISLMALLALTGLFLKRRKAAPHTPGPSS